MRAAADLRLRPRGYWGRLTEGIQFLNTVNTVHIVQSTPNVSCRHSTASLWVSNTESSTFVKSRGISYVNSVSTSEGNYVLAQGYTGC